MLRNAKKYPGQQRMVEKLRCAGVPKFAAVVDEHLAVLSGSRKPSFAPTKVPVAEKR